MSTGSVTPDDLFRLLGVDPDDGAFALVRAARKVKWNFPVTVMSVMAAHGVELSDGARRELDLNRERADRYRAVAAGVQGSIEVKGATLGAAYPDVVMRHAGDLDLVVPRPEVLWDAAGEVALRDEARPPKIAITGPDAAIAVSLAWPSEVDPWLVSDDGIELTTTPFMGGRDGVPVRLIPDVDPLVLSLLAVLEERFQRPFCAADVLDYALILDTLAGDQRTAFVASAIELRLAPELLELSALLNDFQPCILLAAHADGVRQAAEAESARRGVAHANPVRRDGETYEEFLHRGGTWCGLPLDELRADSFRVVEELSEGVVAETPVGGVLLVSAADVAESTVLEAADVLEDVRSNRAASTTEAVRPER